MLTLQSFKSWSGCFQMFKVKQDSQGDDILLTLQGVVSFTDVLEGLKLYEIDLYFYANVKTFSVFHFSKHVLR